MNEEARSEAQAAPEPSEPTGSSTTSSTTSPPSSTGTGLPAWLPYLLIAVVPAVIVGILVYVFAGGNGGGNGNAAGILEAFLAPAEDSNTRVVSYEGSMPDDFPAEFPLFGGADAVVSFAVTTPNGTTYRAIMTSSAPADEVFSYYRDALDSDPWQVEIGQIGAQVTGVQFTRPDDANVSGVVIVNESGIDDQTVIQVVYENLSESLTPGTGPSVPALGQSRPLPPGLPEEVPIYGQDADTIVIDSGFQRGAGGQVFAVSFLTPDSPDDVIDFYRDELESVGWTVTDSTNTDTTSFAVAVEFDDGQNLTSGQVIADTYEEDATYTRVDLVVQVSNAAGN